MSDVYFNTLDKDELNSDTRHWVDVYFPSKKDPSILWNATVISCLQDLDDKAYHQAHDDALKRITEEEFQYIINPEMIPVIGKNGKIIGHQIVFKEQNKKEAFSGRTYYEEIHFQKEQNIQNGIFDIHERYEIYKGYAYGIGLMIVVNEKTLNQEAVDRAIEKFYRCGEKEWINETPVDKKELLQSYTKVFKKTGDVYGTIKVD